METTDEASIVQRRNNKQRLALTDMMHTLAYRQPQGNNDNAMSPTREGATDDEAPASSGNIVEKKSTNYWDEEGGQPQQTQKVASNDDNKEKDDASSDPSKLTATNKTNKSLHDMFGSRVFTFWQLFSLVLNAGLMVYAHVGLSAVIFSNQQRIQDATAAASDENNSSSNDGINNTTTINGNINNSTDNVTATGDGMDANDNVLTGSCSAADLDLWQAGHNVEKPVHGNFCGRAYQSSNFPTTISGGGGCLLNTACHTDCFVQVWNYSAPCAACFAAIPLCSLTDGCAFDCSEDGYSEVCTTCLVNCNAIFEQCSGLTIPAIDNQGLTEAPTASPTTSEANPQSDATSTTAPTTTPTTIQLQKSEMAEEICQRQQDGASADNITVFYPSYDLEFFSAVKVAWNEDARLLAIIVMIFSGIWPYTKNVILAVAWCVPMTTARRDWILTQLRRLGKYTLVDVYVSQNAKYLELLFLGSGSSCYAPECQPLLLSVVFAFSRALLACSPVN